MSCSVRSSAVLLLVAVAAASVMQSAYARSLSEDAWSNSNGCLDTIPKCEPGACATRNVMGVARWVCLRCLSNYEPVVDASGQDNILQCVCPKGTFQNGTDAVSCTRCEKNQYCPGGDKTETPVSYGNTVTCGAGLVTRNTGARSAADCVAPAGYAMTSPTTATACTPSTYAPAFNRLAKCLRCQSGLEENPADNLTDGARDKKRTVCKVPPGRFMSQGLVRICPQGFYRAKYLAFDDADAQKCLACNPGITTNGPGAKSAAECNVVLPGHGISNINATNGTAELEIPTLPTDNTNGLPNATVCPLAYYSSGGYCAQCPSVSVTRVEGAKSVEECVVPPGYYLSAGAMPKCEDGKFREGWVMYSDPKASTCTLCGDNIRSEARDLDENPLAPNGTLVRATSTSCYIEAGQGMIATGKNLFSAKDCPINTYGAAGKVYGWAAAPCKPCPRNMITDGAVKVNNSDVCVNDDGFGYQSEGASRCAPGFYALKGDKKPCRQCAVGRTTADNPALQRLVTDCIVKEGYGVVDSSSNGTDAFNPNTTGLTNETLAQLPVLECPIGYYGPGGAVGSECVACPAGSTTAAPGASAATECSVCVAGYGMGVENTASTGTCAPCPYSSYNPGGLAQCKACPSTDFYGPVDGASDMISSEGTTLYKGSTSLEACVPKKSQLSPEAGQAYFTPTTNVTLTTVTATTVKTCVDSCDTSSGMCCLAQFETSSTSNTCKLLTAAPVAAAASGAQLIYKLPSSELVGASSVEEPTVKAKVASSGYYAHCAAADWNSYLTVGSNLGNDARTFATGAPVAHTASKDACKKACDNSNVCFGFVAVPNGSLFDCYYRGGVDALNGRAFFALPVASSSLDISSLGW